MSIVTEREEVNREIKEYMERTLEDMCNMLESDKIDFLMGLVTMWYGVSRVAKKLHDTDRKMADYYKRCYGGKK